MPDYVDLTFGLLCPLFPREVLCEVLQVVVDVPSGLLHHGDLPAVFQALLDLLDSPVGLP